MVTVQPYDRDPSRLLINFPYDPALVHLVKQLPGRRYLPDRKAWTAPVSRETRAFLVSCVGTVLSEPVKVMFATLEQLDVRTESNLALRDAPDAEVPGYQFHGQPPWAHQRVGVRLLLDNPVFALLYEMRTGKTRTVIDANCALYERGEVDGAVIVTPNNVKGVWADDVEGQIRLHTPPRIPYTVQRIDAGDHEEVSHGNASAFSWVVVNFEAARLDRITNQLAQFLQARRCSMVLDESSAISTYNTQTAKACEQLGKLALRRVILNGTPLRKNPLDFYSQFHWLDPNILGFHSFVAFRCYYAIMGGYEQHEVVEWQHLEELEQKIAAFSHRVLRKDCFDIPPKLLQVRPLRMSQEQWRHYTRMEEELMTELLGQKIAAPITLTKLLRLSQITAGFLPLTTPFERQTVHRFKDNVKLKALKEFLTGEAEAYQVLIVCWFLAEIDGVCEMLEGLKIPHGRFDGTVKPADRDASKYAFQRGELRALVMQEASGAKGIDLTAAKAVVYMTNSPSWEHRSQSEDRTQGPQQKESVLYIDWVTTGPKGELTVDHDALRAVQTKKSLAEIVLDRWKGPHGR